MTRLNESLVVQYVDGTGVVLVDDKTGQEIVIPFGDPLTRAVGALAYFRTAAILADEMPGGDLI